MRGGAVLTAGFLALIAGLAGAMAYICLGAALPQAGTAALGILIALALGKRVLNHLAFRGVLNRQIGDLSRGEAELARQVAETQQRLTALEASFAAGLDETRGLMESITTEIRELRGLLKGVAVSGTGALVAGPGRPASRSADELDSVTPTSGSAFTLRSSDPAVASAEVPGVVKAAPTAIVDSEVVRAALDANRMDVYLQPIVTLPQRKVRYYEAICQLRDETGDILHPADFMPAAEHAGLLGAIDKLAMQRCIALARRLLMKDKEIGLFCSLSPSTLNDGKLLSELGDVLTANRAIAPSIVLQFPEQTVRAMGSTETEILATISDCGFRFCTSEVKSLRVAPAELAKRGFRFLKVNANLLLKPGYPAAGHSAAAELSDLLATFSIDLVADNVANEATVINLIDRDVRLAQGLLFSPPRRVRGEALQGCPGPLSKMVAEQERASAK
jgi:cyclic-di-GMP phosphodiesterase TipF (flagellum assembly factor)